jgi:hypothetical protein
MPAFGTTAKQIQQLIEQQERFDTMKTNLHLTKMANPDPKNYLVTNNDVKNHVLNLKQDFDTKIIFFNVGLCDFNGLVFNSGDNGKFFTESGKYAPRLKTSDGEHEMLLEPEEKILPLIRQGRKDIFLVAFKTTAGASIQEQYLAGLNLLKRNSCNLVLANDVVTRMNMIITPEEAKYHITTDRIDALIELIDMTYYRSHLTFTKSTVVDGKPVSWDNELVYPTLRTVVNHCIDQNAYKPFNGATVGHFACKIGENEFLTSIRKSNFNDLKTKGLVRVVTDGNDSVIAFGAKPSVGGQSQRIVFGEHPEYDCIVHFHCPKKETSDVPVVSQREYECGSHQCGQNTSTGLKKYGNLSAVMLDNHGPNIVFNHNIDPQEVINFIEENFDLAHKTGGSVSLEKNSLAWID